MRKTPLYSEHLAAGARVVEFAGWGLPVQYRSIVDEHCAVRRAAGLFDVSHMGEVEIEGSGAEALCARMLANDVRTLRPGRAQYSLLPNDDGGVVDDVIVYRLEAERFMICLNAANTEKDLAWIGEHAAGSVRIRDRSAATALIAIQGPAAAGIVGRLAPIVVEIPRFAVAPVELFGGRTWVARTGYTGEDGFEVFAEASAAVDLWRALLGAGESDGLRPAGLGARDTLRLEAALPLYGHEIDEDTSPFEVGLGWVVKLNRPDMVGYRALMRAAEGACRRRLVGLEIEGGIARDGCSVVASGEKIGIVTSGSYGPWVRRAIAMALIDRDAATEEIRVEVRGKERVAREVRLPFYSRDGRST